MMPFVLLWIGWLLMCGALAATNGLLGVGLLGVGFFLWGVTEMDAAREREREARQARERKELSEFRREAREQPAYRHDGPC